MLSNTQISDAMVEAFIAAFNGGIFHNAAFGLPEDERCRCKQCLQEEAAAIATVREGLQAALAGHVVGWRDIASAPKDGTEIIGIHFREWDGFKPTVYGPWTVAFNRGSWRSSWDQCEVVNYMSDFGTEYKEPDCEPTHWQPLPAPPALDREG